MWWWDLLLVLSAGAESWCCVSGLSFFFAGEGGRSGSRHLCVGSSLLCFVLDSSILFCLELSVCVGFFGEVGLSFCLCDYLRCQVIAHSP